MTTATVLYVLNNTDDSQRIVIQPRIFDGAGGVQRNTDLTLYGNGAPRWGERFNENFVRLMENFAVAEAGGEDGVPVPNVLPTPKGEIELAKGAGFGINNPVEGQTWFNKSRGTLFVYTNIQSDGTGDYDTGAFRWKPATHVLKVANAGERDAMFPAETARPGELVLNQDEQALQIYDGSTWINAGGDFDDTYVRLSGSNTPMSGALRLHGGHIAPQTDDEAASRFYVLQQTGLRLATAGGTMTGFITLHQNPTAPLHAATKQYVDAAAGGGITDHGALTGLGDDDHTQYVLVNGNRAMTGRLNLPLTLPTLNTHATNKLYVDQQIAAISTSADILLAFGTIKGYTVDQPTYVVFPDGYNNTNTVLVVSMRGPHYVSSSGSYHRCWVDGVAIGSDNIRQYGYVVQCSQLGGNAPATGNNGRNANYWLFKTGDPIPGLFTPGPPATPPSPSDGGGGGGPPLEPPGDEQDIQ